MSLLSRPSPCNESSNPYNRSSLSSCKTHLTCQPSPQKQKLLNLYCHGAHWLLRTFAGITSMYDSIDTDQCRKSPYWLLTEGGFQPNYSDFTLTFKVWAGIFYDSDDSGFGLLTEHRKHSLSLLPLLQSVPPRGICAFVQLLSQPSLTRDGHCQHASSPAQWGKGRDQHIIIQ